MASETRIDSKVMDRILYLSRLCATKPEEEALRTQAERILAYFDVINGYDTDGIDPDIGVAVPAAELRDDTVSPGLELRDLKSFAVNFLDGYFGVPKILDGEDAESGPASPEGGAK